MKTRLSKPSTLPTAQEACLGAFPSDTDRVTTIEESPPRIKSTARGDRLLDVLVHPMRGTELATRLNLSRQRIHQLVVKLVALGLLRVGDPNRVTLIVARHDDPTVLLSHFRERILSSLAETEQTNAPSVAFRLRTPLEEILNQLSWLADRGLVRQTGESPSGADYALTEVGASHPQYRSDAPKARPVSLPVRSDRVREVLSYLADHGPVRIRDLRDRLNIPHNSINALVQYLKRKGLVRKVDDSYESPFELTTEGLNTQRAMIRRSGQERA